MDRRVLLAGTLGLAATPLAGNARKSKHTNKDKARGKGKGKRKKGRNAPQKTQTPTMTSGRYVTVPEVDDILSPLAEQMWHGIDDDSRSLDELEAMIASRQRVMVLCSNQSMLAIRALNRQGIAARMINPLYNGTWNDLDGWGHTSMEVRVEGRWQVFDMTGNSQLVDSNGVGMDVSTACSTRPILTRPFAFDDLWAWSGAPTDLQSYYERIFEIPIIESNSFWRFHDEANRARIQRLGPSWRWANGKAWQKLTS